MGVGKVRVPVKIIVNRMVDSTIALAAISKIQGSNSQVVKKNTVIGAGAQRGDLHVRILPQGLAFRRSLGAPNSQVEIPLPHGDVLFGVLDVSGHTVDEFLERMRA